MTKLIDITNKESEQVGELMDLIEDHLNKYELTGEELKKLDDGLEVLHRLWVLHMTDW